MSNVFLGVAANGNTKLIKLDRSGLVSCDCKHKFQDSRYGKGIRVATPINSAQKNGVSSGRCTVCGAVRNLSGAK